MPLLAATYDAAEEPPTWASQIGINVHADHLKDEKKSVAGET
jgi:hypothetical protein